MNKVEKEPLVTLQLGDKQVTLLGTAHVSRASQEIVEHLLSENTYDAVAVELCSSRHKVITNPQQLANMDLFQVLREGKTAMVMANLALGAYQQRMADELGIEPGAEMRVAVQIANEKSLPIYLIDREIGITLKRIYHNVPWWRRLTLFAGLLASVISHESVSEEDIEKLKQGDILESALGNLAAHNRSLFSPLIDERDQYMVGQLRAQLAESSAKKILVVIGAGHLTGMQALLAQHPAPSDTDNQATLKQLAAIPKGSRWFKAIPWLIVGLIMTGFFAGFRHSPQMGWEMIYEWVLINGGLSALGALVAWGHPLTILTAFLAAPLTSLNPMIGAGMVTALTETWLRKPNVGDFSRLKTDVTHIKGWWHNQVARILLVFFFSSLGSAIGTYIAGFAIFQKLS